MTPSFFLKASPQFSPAHGCGSASTRIYGVAIGQRARRTVQCACALCHSRALYLQASALPRFALRGEMRAWHPRDDPFRARSRLRLSSAERLGLFLVGHRPIRSEGGYSPGPGLWFDFAHHPEPVEGNATCTFLCPRSTGLAPRLPFGCLMATY